MNNRAGSKIVRWTDGFTLLELLIVLLLLGLLLALVAPAIPLSGRENEGAVQQTIDEARRVAIRRAAGVTLLIGSDGQWQTEGSGDGAAVGGGTLAARPPGSLRLNVSPLGACMIEPSEGDGPYLIDFPTCRLRGAGGLP